MRDAIASPTLALLYLAQGHPERARATLDEVLGTEPENGHALALLERLQPPPAPRVELHFIPGAIADAGEIELRWSVPPAYVDATGLAAEALHLALGIARPREHAGLRFTSLRCAAFEGTHRLPSRLGPAALAVSLVAARPGEDLRVLAVAELLSW
ncbi:hypothetical protein G6O69_15095 [Pseudenhygromyxa sp. WMMC2535]|uniref:hypothetical protein n=1 Tax=Pseudenhygromyxa sp. WMMC2535 TaxID=2712867 RepID=UPI001553750E|nr:hypothetical protein [Pseudenhygromyxa sp. WMMC2535]NVB39167.1 hypothetical protein [Pseudenhygromyxa sp. WMMC2535]